MNWRKPLVLLLCWAGLGGCLFDDAPDGMVLVPSGYFSMGTDQVDSKGHALSLGMKKPWFADESPQRSIHLKGFYIDKYEVTNRQYYMFCQAMDHSPPPTWGGLKYPEGRGGLPVTYVSFYDATAYAEWAGKRLPTEAEWEKAARGPDGFLYPWGDEFHLSAANVSRSSKKKKGQGIKPVGSFPLGVSPYGAHDMIGNAWEWVWDYYQPYPGNQYASKDYGEKFVTVRGLSYLGLGHFPAREYKKTAALKARASYREKLPPFARKIDVGFRCAKDKVPFFKKLYEAVAG